MVGRVQRAVCLVFCISLWLFIFIVIILQIAHFVLALFVPISMNVQFLIAHIFVVSMLSIIIFH